MTNGEVEDEGDVGRNEIPVFLWFIRGCLDHSFVPGMGI